MHTFQAMPPSIKTEIFCQVVTFIMIINKHTKWDNSYHMHNSKYKMIESIDTTKKLIT